MIIHNIDILIRIKNGYLVGREEIDTDYSRFSEAILKVLKAEGYIKTYKVSSRNGLKYLTIMLRYEDGKPAISGIKIVSKPGLRIYRSIKSLEKVRGGVGAAVLTTSKGVITDSQARLLKMGGELLFKIW